MPVVMEISFYHYYSGKSLIRLQSRDCTFVQKAGFSLQFHCSLTVKVCSKVKFQGKHIYMLVWGVIFVPFSEKVACIVVH